MGEEEEEGQQKNANLMPHTKHPKLATPKKEKEKKRKKYKKKNDVKWKGNELLEATRN